MEADFEEDIRDSIARVDTQNTEATSNIHRGSYGQEDSDSGHRWQSCTGTCVKSVTREDNYEVGEA